MADNCKTTDKPRTVKEFFSSSSDDFYEHPFLPSPVKLAVENLLPGTEIEFPFGHGHDDLPTHNLPLQVSIPVVFPCAVVAIIGNRLVRGKFLQPLLVILMQAGLVVINEDGSGDVHGIHEHETFADLALLQASLNLRGNVDEGPSLRNMKP